MNEAVGYSRLSQDGLSINRQKDRIRSYCDEHDLELVEIYDDGQYQSGYDDTREAYQELKQRLETSTPNAVVVRDVDRLGRDFDERMDFILALRRHSVELHSAERGSIDLSDPYEAAVEGIHAASADEKKQREIDRAKSAVKERLEKGYDHGRPPFGFQYDEKGRYWVPDDDEFDTARDVLVLRDQDKSYREIEKSTGVSISTVRRILDRREMYENRREA